MCYQVAVIYFIKLQGYVSQTVASVLNITQIQIMSFLYPTVAYALNDYENHRTESDYRDAVVVKLFLFQVMRTPHPPLLRSRPIPLGFPHFKR